MGTFLLVVAGGLYKIGFFFFFFWKNIKKLLKLLVVCNIAFLMFKR
jgi:hypothetical protein